MQDKLAVIEEKVQSNIYLPWGGKKSDPPNPSLLLRWHTYLPLLETGSSQIYSLAHMNVSLQNPSNCLVWSSSKGIQLCKSSSSCHDKSVSSFPTETAKIIISCDFNSYDRAIS